MDSYRYYAFDCLGRTQDTPEIVTLEDDQAAIARLEAMTMASSAEVWCGPRLVAQRGSIGTSWTATFMNDPANAAWLMATPDHEWLVTPRTPQGG